MNTLSYRFSPISLPILTCIISISLLGCDKTQDTNTLSTENNETLSGGKLQAELMSLDHGLYHDDNINFAFSVKNVGDMPVTINSVKGSCGCTDVRFQPKDTLLPGESGEVVGTVDTTSFTGQQNKSIFLKSNSYDTPTLEFKVSFEKPWIAIAPKTISFEFDPDSSTPEKKLVVLRNHGYNSLTLKSLYSGANGISITPLGKSDLPLVIGSNYTTEFEITLDPTQFPTGYSEDKVGFQLTDDDRELNNQLIVRVKMSGDVTAKPDRINFGKVTPAQMKVGLTQVCKISSNSNEPIKIKEVICDDHHIVVTESKDKNGYVDISLQCDDDSGYISTTVKLILESEMNQSVEVNVFAYW